MGILLEPLQKKRRREAIDAHRSQAHAVAPRDRGRVGHLLTEGPHAARAIDLHRAEFTGRLSGHRQAADGHVGAAFLVRVDQRLVVHLVDVVAGEHDHQPGSRHLEGVDVLVDGIGRAEIPILVHPLLRRQHVEKLAKIPTEEPVPANVDVAIEADGLVLREQKHAAQPTIEAVRQREVDDAIAAAERHGGLGSIACQRFKPGALATGKHHRDDIADPFLVHVLGTHEKLLSRRPPPCGGQRGSTTASKTIRGTPHWRRCRHCSRPLEGVFFRGEAIWHRSGPVFTIPASFPAVAVVRIRQRPRCPPGINCHGQPVKGPLPP